MRNRPTGRKNTGPARDKRGDMPLPKSPPQVRAANQNGHPRPKDLQADEQARWEYQGGPAAEYIPPEKRERRNPDADSGGLFFQYPLGRTGGFRARVRMPDDKEIRFAISGAKGAQRDPYVMGQRIGQFCPECSLALPLNGTACPDCN